MLPGHNLYHQAFPGRHSSTNSIFHSTEQGRYTLPSPLPLPQAPLLYAQCWLPRGGAHVGPCYKHPLLRGSSWQQAGRKEAWAAHALPPGPAVWRLALTGPYSPLQRQTKTSLSIMGVLHQREGKTERAKEVRQEGGGAEKWRGEEEPCTQAPQACLKELKKGSLSSKATSCPDTSSTDRAVYHRQARFQLQIPPTARGDTEPEFTLQQLFSMQGTSSRLMKTQEGRPSIAHRQTIQGASPARIRALSRALGTIPRT